jgi:dTDP-4-amino-4,6-dideoxygalactose transaminase
MSFRRKEFLPYALPLIEAEEYEQVREALASGWLSRGPKTQRFEAEFAAYVGAKFAVGLNSCTAGLHLGLLAMGIGPGDEVITTPFTFAATVNTIIHTGATPVLVDIDPRTYNINPELIAAKITSKTKAIVPVHYAGQSCAMDEINAIAAKHGLSVMEDAAHAVYTQYKGRMIGGISDLTVFSFYATKNLCTGEGGMITTSNEELADRLRVYSLHGMSQNAWNRYSAAGSWFYEIEYPGYKYNMTDIQAGLGLAQLHKLERMQQVRTGYVRRYQEAFTKVPELIVPYEEPQNRHAWHLYGIRVREELLTIGRNRFIEELKAANIGTSVHFIPIHFHPYYRERFSYKPGDFPVTEAVYQGLISLPLYPKMTPQDVEDVIAAVTDVVRRNKR